MVCGRVGEELYAVEGHWAIRVKQKEGETAPHGVGKGRLGFAASLLTESKDKYRSKEDATDDMQSEVDAGSEIPRPASRADTRHARKLTRLTAFLRQSTSPLG